MAGMLAPSSRIAFAESTATFACMIRRPATVSSVGVPVTRAQACDAAPTASDNPYGILRVGSRHSGDSLQRRQNLPQIEILSAHDVALAGLPAIHGIHRRLRHIARVHYGTSAIQHSRYLSIQKIEHQFPGRCRRRIARSPHPRRQNHYYREFLSFKKRLMASSASILLAK